ncbi:response regulator [Olivibacter sitiensis]|uniref:response regulator n=1 Tax=Olivibacter sitiensis TaxID=376470 RepID=UPI0003FB2D29|nr:response regulator [Olivibacter sitiensis]
MNDTKKKILVIEDNDDIRDSTEEILLLAGYDVITASEGKTGVDLALKEYPDLILCDIMMPILDGYGVLFMLGKYNETAHIPFIFLTAKSERADMRKAMEMGADDYLTKPFDDMELLNAVEARFKKSEGQRFSKSVLNEHEQFALLEKLNMQGRKRKYAKKQIVYQEGDTPLYIYQVIKGKVRSFLYYGDGRELSTNIHKAGDYLGYEALFANEAHRDNAETIEECEINLINKEYFYEMLYQNPSIARRFANLLSENIRNKEEQMLRLAYHSVRKRVADTLVIIARKFAEEDADQVVLRISREDLAAMAGTAQETISRTLADFKQEKLLSKEGNAIRIHSIDKLSKIKQ